MTMYRLNSVPANVRALPILQSASGSIASFNTDLTNELVEVKCQIVAQQGGSGTPSPDNERPITTYSEMNVVATGKNIFDKGLLLDQVAWNVITLQLKPNTTYTMSSNLPDTATSELPCYFFRTSSSPSSSTMVYSGHAITITTLSDGIGKIQQRRISGTDSFQNYNWQIELGSRETTYEPYNGTIANIPFGQTVANGVLNVITGVLRVTWVSYDMSTLNWENQSLSGGTIGFCVNNLGVKLPPDNATKFDGLCEVYATDTIANVYAKTNDKIIGCYSNIDRIVVYDSDYTNYTDFKNSVVGKKLIFELNSPLEIQLSSTQITALLNENNIWCDTGDTSVKYWMSINKYIGQ